MDNNLAIQIFQRNSDSNLPAITTPQSLADILLDRGRFPRYNEVPSQVRVEWLQLQMIKMMRLSHTKPSDPMVDAVALDDMMMKDRYMSVLTQPEIDYAFRNGVFGLYGEFYGITAMSLFGFLQAFIQSEQKSQAAKLVRQKLYEQEQKAEQERLRAEIEQAKRDGSFVPTENFRENFFKLTNPARDDVEHRKRVLEQARKIKSGEIKV